MRQKKGDGNDKNGTGVTHERILSKEFSNKNSSLTLLTLERKTEWKITVFFLERVGGFLDSLK